MQQVNFRNVWIKNVNFCEIYLWYRRLVLYACFFAKKKLKNAG